MREIEMLMKDYPEGTAGRRLLNAVSKAHEAMAKALRDIVDECPSPKSPYGMKVVEIAQGGLNGAGESGEAPRSPGEPGL